ncbi:hypothetical protein MES5069_860026 [Mesorhizobium escarrei]|uniref:Uncharacterized protein n=1 Tax=Mesorhizobium escarrei TaxID=666018 RepID=A0ABM9EJ41_9HYPH|nr:hypothetical protein MES5069_860026 [Mesorhizobium escarrei]
MLRTGLRLPHMSMASMPRRGTRFHKKGDGGNNFVRMQVDPRLSDPDSVMSLKPLAFDRSHATRFSVVVFLCMSLSQNRLHTFARYALERRASVWTRQRTL